MVKSGQQLPTINQQLFLGAVDVIYSHQRAGEGGDFPERDEERFVDLSFGVDEDSAEEKYETSEGEDSGCQKLQVETHNVGFERNRMQICTRFWRFCKFWG